RRPAARPRPGPSRARRRPRHRPRPPSSSGSPDCPPVSRLPPASHGVMIGTTMTVPIRPFVAGSGRAAPGRAGPGWAGQAGSIDAHALADLLGRWPAADGPLYRLLATRIARLADTGELPAGLRLPPERDLAAALSVSRNTVAAAYQFLRDEGMAESR